MNLSKQQYTIQKVLKEIPRMKLLSQTPKPMKHMITISIIMMERRISQKMELMMN